MARLDAQPTMVVLQNRMHSGLFRKHYGAIVSFCMPETYEDRGSLNYKQDKLQPFLHYIYNSALVRCKAAQWGLCNNQRVYACMRKQSPS